MIYLKSKRKEKRCNETRRRYSLKAFIAIIPTSSISSLFDLSRKEKGMKDFIIFIGEELSRKYPDKTWEELMEIVSDADKLEEFSGKRLQAYYEKYVGRK